MIVNWRKWGIGGSVEFGDPVVLRLWLGPVRIGWVYGHEIGSMTCPECAGVGRVAVEDASHDV